MYLSGSIIPGTAEQLKTDICSMTNFIAEYVNGWAIQEKGIAVVAENLDEKVLPGWNHTVGPKCLVVFSGEELWGDQSVADLVGWAKRNFEVIIERGKLLTDPRNSALTKTYGASKPFYRLVEECRDTIRGMLFPSQLVYNPVMYNGMTPGRQSEKNEWLLDSYIISFSVLCQIPRLEFLPPQLGGGQGQDWVNLQGTPLYPNTSQPVNP